MNTIVSPRTQSLWLPIVLLLVAMASLQSGASLAKSLFPVVGAPGATALRLLIAAILLAVAFRPWRSRIQKGQWRSLITYGAALGVMNLLFFMALQTVPLGIVMALEFTGPLAVALFGARRPRDFIWVALAVLGLLLLLPGHGSTGALDPLGMAYALGAGVCWALYIIFGQKAGAEHGPQTVAIGTAIAALVVVPLGIAHAGTALLSPAILPVAIAVAVLSTALPYSLEMIALTRLPTRTFGMLMSLEPAVAALAGLALLGEQLTLLQWLAIAAIITASTGSTMGSRPPMDESSVGTGSA